MGIYELALPAGIDTGCQRIKRALLKLVLSAGVGIIVCLPYVVQAELPDFTVLIEQNSPAVVKINTVDRASSNRRRQESPQQMPDVFRDFLDQRRSPERKVQAIGSGFIISQDGYILTNNHVIDGADEILVRLNDRQEFEAKVVGTDPRSDLALLKVDAGHLPMVQFAKADDIRVGEWVVAIGSPFGLEYSASAGIVSAVGRSIPTEQGEDYVPFIQTDVAINPGNSGGPLFNLKGEVVGINSQIYTRSGGSIGLSFAIPVSVALEVVQQLKEKGHVQRGWLGVYIQNVNKSLAESLELDKPVGALIAQVEVDSPAADAGIKPGDVVITMNNRDIIEASDLPHTVGLLKPGQTVPLTLISKGKRRELMVKVGSRPGDRRRQAAIEGRDRLGLEMIELDERLKQNSRLSGGALVRTVLPDSPGAEAGLQAGDIIVQLGYQMIRDLSDYDQILAELPGGTPIALRFFRRGRSVFRTIELE